MIDDDDDDDKKKKNYLNIWKDASKLNSKSDLSE